jgi:hypothetical protein
VQSKVFLMRGMKTIYNYAISDGVPRRSLLVALVVGSILNLINQGHALVAGLPVDVGKLLATYIVSYCVCTYGAVTARLRATTRACAAPTPDQLAGRSRL